MGEFIGEAVVVLIVVGLAYTFINKPTRDKVIRFFKGNK